MAHGLSNALLMVPVLSFNLPAAPHRYAEIALALGASRGASDLETASRGLELLVDLCRDCGLPSRISDCGIPSDAIPRLAAAAMSVTRLLRNNPRELTLADAESIYRAAF
jgi:alcohol dehydrogenase class IV